MSPQSTLDPWMRVTQRAFAGSTGATSIRTGPTAVKSHRFPKPAHSSSQRTNATLDVTRAEPASCRGHPVQVVSELVHAIPALEETIWGTGALGTTCTRYS